MQILDKQISLDQLMHLEAVSYYDYMVKGVVDVEKNLLCVNADLHADLEQFLINNGSNQKNLYGINILEDGEIEYDSMINIPRNREAGYARAGRTVASAEVRNRIDEIVKLWIRI